VLDVENAVCVLPLKSNSSPEQRLIEPHLRGQRLVPLREAEVVQQVRRERGVHAQVAASLEGQLEEVNVQFGLDPP